MPSSKSAFCFINLLSSLFKCLYLYAQISTNSSLHLNFRFVTNTWRIIIQFYIMQCMDGIQVWSQGNWYRNQIENVWKRCCLKNWRLVALHHHNIFQSLSLYLNVRHTKSRNHNWNQYLLYKKWTLQTLKKRLTNN